MTADTDSSETILDSRAGLPPGKNLTRFGFWLEFLGSMRLAITLLLVIAIAAVIGTVLQQNLPYNDYISRFGNFWFHVFNTLGLFDVYYSWWFIVILAFLVLSVSVCVYRYAPVMVREMRQNRLTVKLKSLRAFKNSKEWDTEFTEQQASDNAQAWLKVQGYKVHAKQHDDHIVVAGKQGHWNRMGYIFTHVAILLVCLGGLIDGNIGLKFKELFGQVELLKTNRFSFTGNKKSILSINDTMSFRGTTELIEGVKAWKGFTTLQFRDGMLIQKLPFSLKLTDFRVVHYASGPPKSFESDVVIKDLDTGKTFKHTISVNHPLRHRGYAIFQASFEDGGSLLSVELSSLVEPSSKTIKKTFEVHKSYTLNFSKKLKLGQKKLEVIDFKPLNVFPADKSNPKKKFQNFGPSIKFKIRNANGKAQEYVNYGLPRTEGGVSYLVSEMRESISAVPGRFFFVLDQNNSLKRYLSMRHKVFNRQKMQLLINAYVARGKIGERVKKASGETASRINELFAQSLHRLLYVYLEGGPLAVTNKMRQRLSNIGDPAKRKQMESQITTQTQILLQSIISLMQTVYVEVLVEEGVNSNAALSEFDQKFFILSVRAIIGSEQYRAPYMVRFRLNKHIEMSGLQITKAPGTLFVYSGCLMLVIGIYMMFYVMLKRVWLFVYTENGQTRMVFAASCSRPDDETAEYFAALGAEAKRNLRN